MVLMPLLLASSGCLEFDCGEQALIVLSVPQKAEAALLAALLPEEQFEASLSSTFSPPPLFISPSTLCLHPRTISHFFHSISL